MPLMIDCPLCGKKCEVEQMTDYADEWDWEQIGIKCEECNDEWHGKCLEELRENMDKAEEKE